MKYAPKNEHGLYAYVVETRSIWDHARGGRSSRRIVWETSLAEAKYQHGHTREAHATVVVRRAKPEDLGLDG